MDTPNNIAPVRVSSEHIPVMERQVVDSLATVLSETPSVNEGLDHFNEQRRCVDATFGSGGHCLAIARQFSCAMVGIDRDHASVAQGQKKLAMITTHKPNISDQYQQQQGHKNESIRLYHDRFTTLSERLIELGWDKVDAIVADLGVSSMQLDQPERGFSFRHDGPLDMRMDQQQTMPLLAERFQRITAWDLALLLKRYGDEPRARSVATAIKASPSAWKSTSALARLVRDHAHHPKGGSVKGRRIHTIDPATKTFQALRVWINDEPGELIALMQCAERHLRSGGRLVVLCFQSMEDRIIRSVVRACAHPSARIPSDFPIQDVAAPTLRLCKSTPQKQPCSTEVSHNPRARSARLRIIERIDTDQGLIAAHLSRRDVLGMEPWNMFAHQ